MQDGLFDFALLQDLVQACEDVRAFITK